MTRRLIELFRPLRSFAFISITAATIGGIQTSPCSAQGVWAESACGAEIPCGVEAACGAEITRGVEPVCGAERSCDCQRNYQPTPSCGCESSGRGQQLGPEQGLLANAHLHRCRVIDGTINMLACGVKRIATLHRRERHASRASCGCSTCSHPAAKHSIATRPAPCSHCQSHVGSGVPSVPSQTHRSEGAETTTDRDSFTPTLAPRGGQGDQSQGDQDSADGADQEQLEDVFDRWSDPFQDDSVRRTVSSEGAIQQATFDNEVPSASVRQAKAVPSRDTDYADYFRK